MPDQTQRKKLIACPLKKLELLKGTLTLWAGEYLKMWEQGWIGMFILHWLYWDNHSTIIMGEWLQDILHICILQLNFLSYFFDLFGHCLCCPGWSWDYESSNLFKSTWSRTMECCVSMFCFCSSSCFLDGDDIGHAVTYPHKFVFEDQKAAHFPFDLTFPVFWTSPSVIMVYMNQRVSNSSIVTFWHRFSD